MYEHDVVNRTIPSFKKIISKCYEKTKYYLLNLNSSFMYEHDVVDWTISSFIKAFQNIYFDIV